MDIYGQQPGVARRPTAETRTVGGWGGGPRFSEDSQHTADGQGYGFCSAKSADGKGAGGGLWRKRGANSREPFLSGITQDTRERWQQA